MGAGSISHAVGTFDMREMGGLWRKQPLTFAAFLIGALSISGIWPLAGFFSKEEVLGAAMASSYLVFALLLLAAFMTSFYVFRAFFLTFTGRYRGMAHPHESPAVMVVPMLILAALAVGSGYFNINGGLVAFLGYGETHSIKEGLLGILTHPLAWWSIGVALLGIILAFAFYGTTAFPARSLRRRLRGPQEVLMRKYWMDELYEEALARDLFYDTLFRGFAWLDRCVIDGAVNGVSRLGTSSGRMGRRAENGHLQLYAVAALTGVIILAIILLLVRPS